MDDGYGSGSADGQLVMCICLLFHSVAFGCTDAAEIFFFAFFLEFGFCSRW